MKLIKSFHFTGTRVFYLSIIIAVLIRIFLSDFHLVSTRKSILQPPDTLQRIKGREKEKANLVLSTPLFLNKINFPGLSLFFCFINPPGEKER